MAAATFESISKDIREGNLAPVYLLCGEEGFYTDRLVQMFENALPPEDRDFNQHVLYAPEVEPGAVMDLCYSIPMMSDRLMVILKEAQAARADAINKLHKYVAKPSSSTTLVIVFRAAPAKGKDLMAAAKSNAVVFESKAVKDYQMPALITQYIQSKKLTADPKAVEMIASFIGNSLGKVANEIDKLAAILPPNARVTPEVVERNIGISKEFNNFELVDALAAKNAGKAMQIVEYFASNPKASPSVMTTAALYNFFSDLLIVLYDRTGTDDGLMKALNLKSAYPLKRFKTARMNYNARQVIEVIWALRQFDTRSKGVGSRQNEHQLLRELIYHILTARGNLGI